MAKKNRFTEKDRQEIFDMAGLGLTNIDIAAIKRIPITTLKRNFKDTLRTGRKTGKMGLLKTAYYMANVLRDRTMLCFLLKTQGGLRETNRVNMQVTDKRSKDVKRESLPLDPIMAAKAYKEIVTR